MWGLILRTVGNYAAAKHKFNKALKLDCNNLTAKEELKTVDKIIHLDAQIPLEAVPSLRKGQSALEKEDSGHNACSRACATPAEDRSC